MDRVVDLTALVRREVADYAAESPNSTLFFLEDQPHQVFATVVVPTSPTSKTRIVVMARVEGDTVIIDADNTYRPLYEELMHNGVPAQNIILGYAGKVHPPSN